MYQNETPCPPSDYCDLERCLTLAEAARMYRVKPDVLLYFIRFGFIAATYERGVWLVSDTSMKRNFGSRAMPREDVPAYERFKLRPGKFAPRGAALPLSRSREEVPMSEAAQARRGRPLTDKKKT